MNNTREKRQELARSAATQRSTRCLSFKQLYVALHRAHRLLGCATMRGCSVMCASHFPPVLLLVLLVGAATPVAICAI
jgi:hypothetical protein